MSFAEKIKEFDKQTSDFDVEFEGVNIWPYLRFYTLDRLHFNKNRKPTASSWGVKLILKSTFKGWSLYFKTFDAIVFMASSDRRFYQGKWTEKTDFLPQYLGKTLFVELPNKGHFNASQTASDYVSSRLVLTLFEKLLMKFVRVNKQALEIESELNNQWNVESNLTTIYQQFVARYKIATKLFLQTKPKVAVVDAAYVDMPVVLAAHKLGVEVIEMQHGTINKQHHGYQIYNQFNKSLYTDYLLCFGQNDKNFFNTSSYINSEKVFPVGNYYLDYIRKNLRPTKAIKQLKSNHHVLITATGQDAYDDQLIPFLNQVLELKKNWACLFVPRSKNKNYYRSNYKLNERIFFNNELNTYELIACGDVHTTVNSTCALESVAIGVPNVLYDYNNKATAYFETLLTSKETNALCANVNEFVEQVELKAKLSSNQVIQKNSDLFKPNYFNNLKLFFETKN